MSKSTHTDSQEDSIFQINIQGLRGKCSVLETFMLEGNYNFSAICIAEHWLSDAEIASLGIAGYCLGSFFVRETYRRGGVAILVRIDVPFVQIDFTDISVEKDGEVVGVRFPTRRMIIVCIYRSPSGSLEVFLDILSRALSRIVVDDYNVVLVGDFNVHFNNSGAAETRSVCEFLTEYGLQSDFADPTRLGNCIDNAFTNILPSPRSTTVNFPFSDHNGVATYFSTLVDVCSKIERVRVRPVTEGCLNAFSQLVESSSLDIFYDERVDVNDRMTEFVSMLAVHAERAFPIRTLRVNCSDTLRLSWFTPELRRLRTCLHDINREYQNTGSNYVKTLRDDFRERYRVALAQARRDASERYIRDHGRSSSSIWKIIKKGNKNQAPSYDEPAVSPDAFNAFFLDIPNRLTTAARGSCDPLSIAPFARPLSAYFEFDVISRADVLSAINTLKLSKSRDYFGLSAVMLKHIRDLIVTPLTVLFNSCISAGRFPDVLKIACVTPVHKKGDINDPSNYRPISILPVVSKVFELILKKQFVAYLEENSILHINQHGFRSGHSTGSAVVSFVEKIVECFEGGDYCSVEFLDLSKAFDCVSHDVLVRKMYMYNVLPRSVKLFSSYLSNRQQCVRIGTETSSMGRLTSGVAQGAIIGPIMFLLYVNDFPNILEPNDSLLYADDTTIFSRGSSLGEVAVTSANKISIARRWFEANGLTLNDSKAESLLFTLRRGDGDDGDRGSTRFLGVYVDTGLTWHAHGDALSARLSSAAFALRRLSESVSRDALRIAYFALFQSHLIYGLLSWGHSVISKRVFALQRRAVRIMCGLGFRDDCRAAFTEMGILTLPSLYIYECLKYVLANRDRLTYQNSNHNHHTRQNENIRYERFRLSRSRNGANYYGYKFYNAISPERRSLQMGPLLKHVKGYLMRYAFYNTDEFLTNPLR